MRVEHARRFDGGDSLRDRLDSFGPPPLAKIRDTFNQSLHDWIIILAGASRSLHQPTQERLATARGPAQVARYRVAAPFATRRSARTGPHLSPHRFGSRYRSRRVARPASGHFFARELPQTFRRTWRYTLLSFSVFAIFALIGFVGTRYDPEFSELVGVDPSFRELYIETKTPWWESLNEANQIGATSIMTHNIQVTIYTFAFGATCGIGTLFYLALNGANFASILTLCYRAGFGNDLLTFVVAHGVVELSCIFIAGGAGLLIGSAMIIPGNLSRADALRTRGMEAVRLMVGVAVLLVVAGTIEGFISPALIDPRIKYSIAALTGVTLYAYLFLAGHEKAKSQ
jgi:uncharacterized membrane protein SpoIIM required for sporulation